MFKRALILAATIAFFLKGYSQPDKIMSNWVEKNPIEKVYLHFDRSDYIAGQTIWFKGYLYSDFLASTRSTTLFVELLDTSSRIIDRVILPVFGSYTRGQFELPDTLEGGAYTIRAYTTNMLNHDAAFVYKKYFFITGKKKISANLASHAEEAHLEFFPEGGNMITGLSNSLAFKATNENGLPISVAGEIRNEEGEKVAEFSSIHDGMGYFDLTAEANTKYYAILKNDPSAKKFYLPEQTTKGVVFRVISSGPTKSFEILQRSDEPVFKAAYVLGQTQHHVVFKKIFKEGSDEITGVIPTSGFFSGILHLTVFNKDGMPLAERLTFIDNHEYIQQGDIIVDTVSFLNRGKNHFTLSLKDTVRGSFSISISDATFERRETRMENIFSGLLLTSDIKGYVHDPAYYFSSTTDSVQNALDLVMMTSGWRRFAWNEIIKNPLPAKKYTEPGYITLSGKIMQEGTRKPFADKELLTLVVSPGSGKTMLLIKTNAEGYFKIDSLMFFGRARVLFSDIKGKRSRFIDVTMGGDSLNRSYVLPDVVLHDHFFEGELSNDKDKLMREEYDAILKAEGLMLEGVTVKARKKTPLEEVEEKYVSSLFSGNANSTLNLTEENLMAYQNIFEYLKMRVPGLQITTDPTEPGYVVKYRQQALLSSLGEIPMAIYLNEVPSDAEVIATIPAHQVALVKVYSSFTGASGNAPGGVLAIYTKKGADLASLPSSGDVINYKGYSVIKEFYSPDYKVDNVNTEKADTRMTLYWNPAIFSDDINPKMPVVFYNNDRTKQFKIVVEGLTADGKMLMIEKTIGGRKGF